jgi:hypothetical protein
MNHAAIRQIQGFAVHVLHNDSVELAMAPELGAKVISLKNVHTGREWLWHPEEKLRLFKNLPRDNFAASPLVGMDECLPTIQPCSWRGRELPDHGEVWSQPWQVDEYDLLSGKLTASINLRNSPLAFQRTISLTGNEIRFSYQLSNLAADREHFVWAVHPLLRLVDGDVLEVPASTRELLNGHAWIDAVSTAIPKANCAKVFACPVREGRAVITNEAQADRLEFVWNTAENNSLGLWLTRGGWHGHHHFAIEPTNSNDDSLAIAAIREHCGSIPGHGTVSWEFRLRVGI